MSKSLPFLYLFSLLFFVSSTFCAEKIYVGVYDFPPYVTQSSSADLHGVTVDLVEGINKLQNKYEFVLFLTTPKRRYIDFSNNRFDLMFFEDQAWGWKDYPTSSSKVFLKGGEVFIANSTVAKNQSYFDTLKGKSLIGILGYHYAFANYDSTPKTLREKFNMTLLTNHEAAIKMVLNKRINIGIISKSYLDKYLKDSPHLLGKLIISKKMNQEYNHTVLIRRNGKVTTEWMNSLLTKMAKQNIIKKVFAKYGLSN